MGPALAGVAGPLEGIVAPIENELSIGRAPSNRLMIEDPSIGERQCLIKKEGEQFKIWDFESHTRTFVNGLPAKGLTLKHGDHIKIGTSLFLVLLHPEVGVRPCSVQLEELVARSTVRLRREEALNLLAESVTATPMPVARARRDLNALLKISTALSSIRGLAALERPLLELIFEVIPAERGVLLLTDKDSEEFESLLRWDRLKGLDGSIPIQVSRTIAEKVLRQAVAILSNDVCDPEGPAKSTGLGRRSVLAVPMVVFDQVLGVIYMETRDPLVRFDEGHLQLMTVIAGIAAMALGNLRHVERLESDNRRLQAQITIDHDMVGDSPQIREVYQFISKVAATDSTVLIRGESGTGKELVARAMHRNSLRFAQRLVAINCAAVTETLLESELFGYEKGAFTGALAQKSGKLEVADGGTVFLDEVSELPLTLQPKLLRVLQEREFERVGGTRPIKVDIRLIAATNTDLDNAVAAGRFRSDLYYRLNVVSLTIPPLRERREDIPVLATYFAARYSAKIRRRIVGIAPEAEALMTQYHWPGNVRELQNVIERAVVLGSGDYIVPEDLPEAILENEPPASGALAGYHNAVRRVKRGLIIKAVEQAGGNYEEAARVLGLNANYLHRLIRQMDLKATLKKLT
jgi:two-component system, NtrC family, response regulator HydG